MNKLLILIIRTIFTLLQLNICSTELSMKNHLEETIKIRLRTDINDSFSLYSFVFNDKDDIQFNKVQEFFDYVKKLDDSMAVIHEYQTIFALFHVNYIKICFFETNSAADRVTKYSIFLINIFSFFLKYF